MDSFLAWFGGKRIMSGKIVEMIPEHDKYVEVFAGAAWVLFKKPRSSIEVINDLDGELVNLYRVVKHHFREFLKEFRWGLISRHIYGEWARTDPTLLTDVQRAARFYFVLKLSFGSLMKNPHYSIKTGGSPKINFEGLPAIIERIHERLAGVDIEQLDFAECIKKHDDARAFFYIDPPYWGIDEYRVGFTYDDQERLRAALDGLQGRFIVSLNDMAEVRELYRAFTIIEASNVYTAGPKNRKVQELLIANYDIEPI